MPIFGQRNLNIFMSTGCTTALARSRREANPQRRVGTGRQTTKRNFSLNLFGLLAAPSPRLPLTERSPGQQQLQPVDEDAASCSAAGAMDVACDEPLVQSDAADDEPEPEAFDTAHAPTPFRKSNKVMRTPAAGKDTGASVRGAPCPPYASNARSAPRRSGGAQPATSSACPQDDDAPGSPTEEPAALPMSAFDDVADEPSPAADDVANEPSLAAADATSPAAADAPVVAEEHADAPDAMDEEAEPHAEPSPARSTTHSIGLSPIAAEQERLRKSMGTSPIAPELLQLTARPAMASSSTSPAGAWSPAAERSPAAAQSPDGAESLAAEQSPAAEQTPGVQYPGMQFPEMQSPGVPSPAAAESPAVESPAEQSPAAESPAVESPAVESPVVDTPVAETPVAETPVAEEEPEAEEPAEEPAADSDGDDGDGGGASDCGSPGFEDNCSMGDAEEEEEEAEAEAEEAEDVPLAPEEEMPPPPPPSLGELMQQNMPAEPKGEGRAAPGSARKRKTSLDKLGRLPSGAEASTGLVQDAEGGRRSKRNKMAPLEFWRNERVEYGRRASAKFAVPVAVTFQPKEGTPNWVQRARSRVVEHKAEAAPAKKRAGKKAASQQ